MVQFPKSLSSRCGKCLQILCCFCWGSFAFFLFLAVVSFSYLWIPVLMSHCHKPPGIGLANVSIFNMTLQESSNTSTPGWLVHAKFNVTFSAWNRNTVAKCFSTYRTMNVDVRFKNSLILQQSVPLGFSLKPKAERPVLMDLTGDQFTMKQDLGPVMEDELRTGNVTMEFFFNTRYLIADRRSKWHHFGCSVVVRSPLVQSNGLNTLVDHKCYLT